MRKTWLTALSVFVVLWILLFVLITGKTPDQQPVQQGLLDLRSTPLANNEIALSGQWRFYWNQLITPGDTAGKYNYTRFPGLWHNIEKDGKPLPSIGYATYGLTILLPRNVPEIGLRIPDMYSSYRLYVNDSIYASNGYPATVREEARPFWGRQIAMLPRHADTVHLLLQVANFWHSKGGPHKTIVVGDIRKIVKESRIDWGLDAVTTGFMLMSGFLFFSLYLFARSDKAILYFALFCFTYSYRIMGTEPYTIFTVFTEVNWFLALRLEYLSLVWALVFLFLYIRHLYPKETNKYVIRVLLWVSIFFSFIIVTTPVYWFSSVMPFYLTLLFFYLAYATYVFICAYFRKRNGSDFALLGTSIAIVVFFFLNLNYFKLAPVMKLMVCTGYILFLFMQAIILSSRFAFILRRSAIQAQMGVKAKSEFLSTMSHEIRTPLNAIVGLVHILLKGKPAPEQKETIDGILFSANNLRMLVDDILDYNKLDAHKMQLERIEMNLRETVKNIIIGEQSFADSKRIRLESEIDSRIPERLLGDPVRIPQVITNLVHNAIKFTDEGWVKLSLKAEKAETDRILVTFRVQDSGIGIAPGEHKRIFQRFVQADSSTSRKYGGSGLGLPICKKILDLYNSKLELESSPGNGSSFWFTLSFPVPAREKSADVLPLTEADKCLQNNTIMVVEDNQLNALIAKTILEDFGAQVELVENGRDAVEKFDAGIYQAVIMDLNMPEMDGFEATRQIRRKCTTTPVIALTAAQASEVADKATEAGISAVVGKPFDPEELCRVICSFKS